MTSVLDITTFEQLRIDINVQYEILAEAETVLAQVRGWLDRGDKVLVYENRDLGHYALGDHVYASYGSAAAQLDAELFSEPPQSLPDLGGLIGWRYQLVGVVTDGA